MADHQAELHDAAEEYRRARQRADEIMAAARTQLAERVRAAYADGMKKADILRATGHVWSRQWLDETLRDQ